VGVKVLGVNPPPTEYDKLADPPRVLFEKAAVNPSLPVALPPEVEILRAELSTLVFVFHPVGADGCGKTVVVPLGNPLRGGTFIALIVNMLAFDVIVQLVPAVILDTGAVPVTAFRLPSLAIAQFEPAFTVPTTPGPPGKVVNCPFVSAISFSVLRGSLDTECSS
jgi:hypothetical protein